MAMLLMIELEALPQESGTYQILDNQGTVIYVGQSKNIHTRWKNGHHKLSVIVAECGASASIPITPSALPSVPEPNAAILHHQRIPFRLK
jgi:hypothetical protein